VQIDRNAFVRWAERARVRLLLYFRWVIYSEEEALLASKYLRFLALLEEREQALLAPAVQEVSLVSTPASSRAAFLTGRFPESTVRCMQSRPLLRPEVDRRCR
jgi:hypothetical protein